VCMVVFMFGFCNLCVCFCMGFVICGFVYDCFFMCLRLYVCVYLCVGFVMCGLCIC